MIAAIKDVFYCASDMDRSVAFYRRLLGCEPQFASDYWTEFGVGGVSFGIHWSEGRPIVRSDPGGAWAGATVSFRVEDIDQAATALREWGVEIVGEIDRQPWGNRLTIQDPDGNLVKLMTVPTHESRSVKQP
jgi:catechol 2,3-dioxygenase-like lactoylglutathione lyase family enzyme